MSNRVLTIDNVRLSFPVYQGEVHVLNAVSMHIDRGEIVGVVGESGSGKSVTAMLAMRLLPPASYQIHSGQVTLLGNDILQASEKEMRDIRGRRVAMIFQEPMTALNPTRRIGKQMVDVIRQHRPLSAREARARAVALLADMQIADPQRVMERYPFELSGGMRQRVMIAIAFSCEPDLLIADEPTTALDVTIQAQIIELLLELQQKENMALVLITHDLALVAEAAHKIIVMYAGQVVETGDAHAIFHAPRHPYTQALLRALPEFAQDKERLASLPGVVPGKYDRPNGCLLNPRCPYATDRCRAEEPALNMLADGRQSKCHYPLDDAGRPTL